MDAPTEQKPEPSWIKVVAVVLLHDLVLLVGLLAAMSVLVFLIGNAVQAYEGSKTEAYFKEAYQRLPEWMKDDREKGRGN